jgi:hypothetical protein
MSCVKGLISTFRTKLKLYSCAKNSTPSSSTLSTAIDSNLKLIMPSTKDTVEYTALRRLLGVGDDLVCPGTFVRRLKDTELWLV